MILVKNLKNKRKVVFDSGRFDDWCVWVVEAGVTRKAPLDITYFTDLKRLDIKYGNHKVYHDFLKIYTVTTKEIQWVTLKLIDEITDSYLEEDKDLIEQWFTVIYAGMIAEENKENAILKKRIKHLGIHQTLVQDLSPEYAANYSKGQSWKVLDDMMKSFGI